MFFFFSSRRRHTRSKRDWSSDVCSSDLPPNAVGLHRVGLAGGQRVRQGEVEPVVLGVIGVLVDGPVVRSEERRVGKECGCRWVEWDYSKKIVEIIAL